MNERRLEKQTHGGDRKSESIKSKGQNAPLIKTSEKTAKETSVNEKTIERDAKYAESIGRIAEGMPEKIETVKALPNSDATLLAKKELR